MTDRTGSGSCLMMGFGINSVESLHSASTMLVDLHMSLLDTRLAHSTF
jgi:hypothetical protein